MEKYKCISHAEENTLKKFGKGLLRGAASLGGGMASIFDFSGNIQRPRRAFRNFDGPEADRRTLESNWQAVGADLSLAIRNTTEAIRQSMENHGVSTEIPDEQTIEFRERR